MSSASKTPIGENPHQAEGLDIADVALWVSQAPLEEVALVAKLCAKRTGVNPPATAVSPKATEPEVFDWATEVAGAYAPVPAQPVAPYGAPYAAMAMRPARPFGARGGRPPAVVAVQGVPVPGESGSGYTRLPNGKLVKNQKPKARPLQEAQAKNWQERAQNALRDYVATAFARPPKEVQANPPQGDARYDTLVADLEWAKAYRLLVHQTPSGTQPITVDEYRRTSQRPVVHDGRVVPEPVAEQQGPNVGPQPQVGAPGGDRV